MKKATVSNTVTPCILYLLLFVATLILLGTFQLLRGWGIAGVSGVTTYLSGISLFDVVSDVLPASCFLALIFTFFRILKKPGSRFFTYLFLLAVSAGTLIFGEIGLDALHQDGSEQTMPPYSLRAGEFYELKNEILYSDREASSRFSPLIRIGEGEWRMKYYPYADSVTVRGSRELRLPEGDDSIRRNIKLAPSRLADAVFRWEPLLASLKNDYQFLRNDLHVLKNARQQEFILLSAAACMFLIGSQLIMRISKWPILSMSLMLLMIRGVLYLYVLLRIELVPNLASSSALLPAAFFAGWGLILILVDFLFVPFNRWEERFR